MIRYLPPNGTAGLARSWRQDREALALAAGEDHRHRPLHGPASSRGNLSPMGRCTPCADASTRRHAGSMNGRCRAGQRRRESGATARPGAVYRNRRGLTKSPLNMHRPVEVRAGRVAGVALVADDLAGRARGCPGGCRPGSRLHVGVPGLEPGAVGDDHDPGRVGAVGVVPADVRDDAVARGADLGAGRRDDVDALVEVARSCPAAAPTRTRCTRSSG